VPPEEEYVSKPLNEQVAVLGVGCTKFGDNVDQSLSDMMVDAAQAACQDADVTLDELQAAWLGTFSPGFNGGKASITLADALPELMHFVTRLPPSLPACMTWCWCWEPKS
jgi:acetyl-CoA C-acetyltransferase